LFERRLYYHIDWALIIAVLALCTLGVVMIYSTSSDPTRGTSRLYIPQLYALALGLVAMLFTALSYRAMSRAFPIAGSVYSYAGRGIGKEAGFIAGWAILLVALREH